MQRGGSQVNVEKRLLFLYLFSTNRYQYILKKPHSPIVFRLADQHVPMIPTFRNSFFLSSSDKLSYFKSEVLLMKNILLHATSTDDGTKSTVVTV